MPLLIYHDIDETVCSKKKNKIKITKLKRKQTDGKRQNRNVLIHVSILLL